MIATVAVRHSVGAVLRFGIATGLGLLASGCLVDSDDPCGDALIKTSAGACVCPKGHVPSDSGCVPCAENERAAGGQCVCEDGFSRASASASCEPVSEQPGCSGSECPGEGACASSANCAAPRLCDRYGTRQCVEPPVGLGRACASDADCAGTDATYCEVHFSLTCVIQGCKEDGGRCPGDMQCCDFAILTRSLCVGADALTDGACPIPGVNVERE
ncbi:MAG: hypothetical protein M3020_07005 [Myxococcota bacterium]|nr:hypothetical protein [Myxococcota bacterium]